MQSGQDWDGDNGTGPLDRPTQGRILAQSQVRARLIVICRVESKNAPQVLLTEDQHPVQALAAHGADQAFRIAILPRRSRRDRSVADKRSCNDRRHVFRKEIGEEPSVGHVSALWRPTARGGNAGRMDVRDLSARARYVPGNESAKWSSRLIVKQVKKQPRRSGAV
jgi:hypothetical protein